MLLLNKYAYLKHDKHGTCFPFSLPLAMQHSCRVHGYYVLGLHDELPY